MPKHLYTIPSGTTLPAVTGLPEGSPFLLLTSDETVPGTLHVLQGSAFVEVGAGGGGGGYVPVELSVTIPTTAVAAGGTGTSYSLAVPGTDVGYFMVPTALSSNGTVANAVLREVTMVTDFADTAPNDTITLEVSLQVPPSTTVTPYAPLAGPIALDSTHASLLFAVPTYDATATANQLPAGSWLSADVVAGPAFTSTADMQVLVTLWFGPATTALLTRVTEEMLVEREHQLSTPA